MRTAVLPLLLLPLAACAGKDRVIERVVPVASPCVPPTLGPAPDYPDTDQALREAPDAAARYQILGAGRPLRVQRLEELETVVAGCPKAQK